MTTPITVLAVVAHPDDELACAGALIKHALRGDRVIIAVVTAGTSGPGQVSERVREMHESAKIINAEVVWGDFLDGSVSTHERDLVQFIETQIKEYQPDTIYAHGTSDSHQDHRAVALATLGAARGHNQILQFESPSSICFEPTVFVDISDVLDLKIKAVSCHDTQVASSRMVDLDYIRGQATYRGFQSRTTAAEGFLPVRFILNLSPQGAQS